MGSPLVGRLNLSLLLCSGVFLDVPSGEVPGQTYATRRIAPLNFCYDWSCTITD